jgi:hypothetical protein
LEFHCNVRQLAARASDTGASHPTLLVLLSQNIQAEMRHVENLRLDDGLCGSLF